MILFITYTILAFLAIAAMAKLLHFSIQRGQWLGGWQNVLRRIAESKNPSWSKPLGYCEVCFAHMLAFIGFFVYLGFVSWVGVWPFSFWQSAVWYLVFVPISSMLNLYFITKLFDH